MGLKGRANGGQIQGIGAGHIDNGVGVAHGDGSDHPLLPVYRQRLLNKTVAAAFCGNVLGS